MSLFSIGQNLFTDWQENQQPDKRMYLFREGMERERSPGKQNVYLSSYLKTKQNKEASNIKFISQGHRNITSVSI